MTTGYAREITTQAGAGALRTARRLSLASLIGAVALLALGTVLAGGDSTAACEGWPLCDGEPSALGLLNVVHRLGGLVLVVATGLLVAQSYARLRDLRWLVRLSVGVFTLVMAQSVLGGLGVAYDFPGWASASHLALALAIITGLLTAFMLTTPVADLEIPERIASLAAGAGLTLGTLLVVAAAYVGRIDTGGLGDAAGAAGLLYLSFPVALALTGGLGVASRSLPGNLRFARRLSRAAVGTLLAAIVVLGLHGVTPYPRHVGTLALVMVIFAEICLAGLVIAANAGTIERALSGRSPARDRTLWWTKARDFLRVTKPGIMTLLLTTTFGSMLVAAAGWPGWSLVGWTLLGGALASGGASAMNCYFDRDIDQIMARTRRRPIPTGSLTPTQVRNFALLLSFLSVAVLVVFVNPLAAGLALGGNLFYVAVYTLWLKRSTPQNIVIGGAAGSFPPLVGWAAVTGSLAVTPLLIAAIIFFWTPPHFWALALLKANDYRRAGIPMLPVTHGDDATRRSILRYSVVLVAITLLASLAGPLGWLYLAFAATLGAVFIAYAVQMEREATNRLAWRLFKFSNYYLALLLAVMVLDAAV